MSHSSRFFRLGSALVLTLVALAALLASAPGVRAQDGTHEIELVGPIQAVSQNTITVNGLIVNVTDAEIQTTLAVSAAVRIHGLLQPDGTIRAREISAAQAGLRPGEIEVIGTLDSIVNTTMTISGLRLDVSSQISAGGLTFDVSKAAIEPGLAPGDLVKVHAVISVQGVAVVREVSRYTPDSTSDDNSSADDNSPSATETPGDQRGQGARAGEFEIVGSLAQIGSGFIVVSGQTISTQNAEIKDALVVGALVKVHLSVVNGQWVAREVEFAAARDGRGTDDSSGHDAGDDHGGNSGSDSLSDQNDDHGANSGNDSVSDQNDDHGANSGNDSASDQNDDHGGNSGGGGSDDHSGGGHD